MEMEADNEGGGADGGCGGGIDASVYEGTRLWCQKPISGQCGTLGDTLFCCGPADNIDNFYEAGNYGSLFGLVSGGNGGKLYEIYLPIQV